MNQSDLFAVAFLGHYIDKFGRAKHKLWLSLLTVEPHEDIDNIISYNIAQEKQNFNYAEIETTYKYLGMK